MKKNLLLILITFLSISILGASEKSPSLLDVLESRSRIDGLNPTVVFLDDNKEFIDHISKIKDIENIQLIPRRTIKKALNYIASDKYYVLKMDEDAERYLYSMIMTLKETPAYQGEYWFENKWFLFTLGLASGVALSQ